MRKLRLLIFALLLPGGAVSCSTGTVESGGEQQPAGVTFVTGFSSRSAIGTKQELAAAGGFSVWGYSYTGAWSANPEKTALFENTTVTSPDNGATWSYGSQVFWPSTPVSFFAYAPAGSGTAGTFTPDGVPVIDFVIGATAAEQKDLLVATPQFDLSGTNYVNNTPVALSFSHALSRIKFSAILSETFTETVKVTKVELKNIYNQGEIPLETPPAWTISSPLTANYTLSTGSGLEDLALTATSQNITSEDGVMFLMPQNIQRSNNKPEMKITITVDGSEVVYELPLFSPVDWLPGKSYDYQLYIDRETIQVIVIDSNIALQNWDTYIMIQPVPLTSNQADDLIRLKSALSSLVFLNGTTDLDLTIADCKYFAIYLKNSVNHDITIDMADYESGFTDGEWVMFDGKKMVETWGEDASNVNYKFEVVYNPAKWVLADAYQPYPGLDAMTGATTSGYNGSPNTNTPSAYIRNKGSVILIRNATP